MAKTPESTLGGDYYKRTGRAKQDIANALQKAKIAGKEVSINATLQETMALYGVGRKPLMEFIEFTVSSLGGEIHGDDIEWPLSAEELALLRTKRAPLVKPDA